MFKRCREWLCCHACVALLVRTHCLSHAFLLFGGTLLAVGLCVCGSCVCVRDEMQLRTACRRQSGVPNALCGDHTACAPHGDAHQQTQAHVRCRRRGHGMWSIGAAPSSDMLLVCLGSVTRRVMVTFVWFGLVWFGLVSCRFVCVGGPVRGGIISASRRHPLPPLPLPLPLLLLANRGPPWVTPCPSKPATTMSSRPTALYHHPTPSRAPPHVPPPVHAHAHAHARAHAVLVHALHLLWRRLDPGCGAWVVGQARLVIGVTQAASVPVVVVVCVVAVTLHPNHDRRLRVRRRQLQRHLSLRGSSLGGSRAKSRGRCPMRWVRV